MWRLVVLSNPRQCRMLCLALEMHASPTSHVHQSTGPSKTPAACVWPIPSSLRPPLQRLDLQAASFAEGLANHVRPAGIRTTLLTMPRRDFLPAPHALRQPWASIPATRATAGSAPPVGRQPHQHRDIMPCFNPHISRTRFRRTALRGAAAARALPAASWRRVMPWPRSLVPQENGAQKRPAPLQWCPRTALLPWSAS